MESTIMPPMSESNSERRRGIFVVVDGVDGCGKTTQAARLVEALRVDPELHLREPGSTVLGERLRELLLSREHQIEPAVETLLFAAARRQMLDQIVAPALSAGRSIVCERFNPSTYSYQSVAGDLDEQQVLSLLQGWASEPSPDLVLLLDVQVADAARRRGAPSDRIEAKGLEFQERVAEGYRRYAQLDPVAVLLDGSGSEDEVHERVMREVERVCS